MFTVCLLDIKANILGLFLWLVSIHTTEELFVSNHVCSTCSLKIYYKASETGEWRSSQPLQPSAWWDLSSLSPLSPPSPLPISVSTGWRWPPPAPPGPASERGWCLPSTRATTPPTPRSPPGRGRTRTGTRLSPAVASTDRTTATPWPRSSRTSSPTPPVSLSPGLRH